MLFYSSSQHPCGKACLRNSQMPWWPFSGHWQPVKQDESPPSLVPISLPADWCSSLLTLFPFHRTGLEAIMETYAFWRPPVRTLTFEDFTTMQKQQGERTKGMQRTAQRAAERAGEEGARAVISLCAGGEGSHALLSSWCLWKDTEQRGWMSARKHRASCTL